jgi:hypothetical protein
MGEYSRTVTHKVFSKLAYALAGGSVVVSDCLRFGYRFLSC